jgi:Kef-type K+ transport system membrane component KefB
MFPDDLVVFFLEIAVMLFTALLCGQLARRVRLPAVIGELTGGILLGPTVWGWLSPGSHAWLFPASGAVFAGRDAVIQLCMLFFLFAAGLEVDFNLIKGQRRRIIWTTLPCIMLPFALGFGLVVLFPGLWEPHARGGLLLIALFMGTALAISAPGDRQDPHGPGPDPDGNRGRRHGRRHSQRPDRLVTVRTDT